MKALKISLGFTCIVLFVLATFYFYDDFSYSNVTLNLKILLDQPICSLQNAGVLEKKRASFSLLDGKTINIYRCRESSPPKLIGDELATDLVVVSDFGGRVQRLSKSGRLMWSIPLVNPRGLDIYEGFVYVADGKRVLKINWLNGEIVFFKNFSDYVVKTRFRDGLLWVLFGSMESSLNIFTMTDGGFRPLKIYENIGSFARDFDFDDEYFYVADTFGHRVRQLNRDTSEVISEVASFFPNSVQLVGKNTVLVAEEHLNAITYFDLNKKTRTVEYSCKSVQGTNDLLEMKKLANRPIRADLGSPCQAKIYADRDIFSPNDVFKYKNGYYIADTDNHRVIYLSPKNGFSSVVGFNDPVSVFPISD